MQSFAQENLGYQKPPKEILDLVDFERAPIVQFNPDRDMMLLLFRDGYKSIADLSRKELRLAGLRIDPKTNIGSRVRYYNNVKIRFLEGKNQDPQPIAGLPENPQLTNFSWSPDYQKIAFTNTVETGVELWVLDIKTKHAQKLTNANLNANMGDVINWTKDSKHIIYKRIPSNRKPLIDTDNQVPSGPTISTSDGEKAQNRTYQDLLKNKNDEHNFEQLALSELVKIDIEGNESLWLESAMYGGLTFSPDGNYALLTTINRPFSYLVPYYRFASKIRVYNKDGKLIATVQENPLREVMPKGFMAVQTGRRSFNWRADRPASLYFAVAQDEGDPSNEVEFRDEVFQLDAPFTGNPVHLVSTKGRYRGIGWCDDETAFAYDYWWNTRNMKTYAFDPSEAYDKNKKVLTLHDRNYQDRYSDPGSFVYEQNEYGRYVISKKGDKVYLTGAGYTPEGQFPFVDELNLKSQKTKRLYESRMENRLESLYDYNVKSGELLVRIEGKNEYPNYYFRDLKKNKLTQLTFNKNPFESISEVEKTVLKYKRKDGVDLSGTLYLPAGYDKTSGKKLPLILWAYPREYKDKSSAGQTTQNPNQFTYPYYGSMVYWVTQGYAVLDNASFPIIGEGDNEPNDNFRWQLVANAKAAIDAVDSLGYINSEKVAVGGHSYGAFMVANLLSHSNLFAAGIARSGAYNRTLTPFGFQSEERSYWDAPDVYNTMSPFMHADKMKTPLLLIHGEADNNSGTYPLQSERYFNALKGLGAPVRLVMLPKESHGYAAKESILHILWEQHEWLEKHVKGANED